jgi:hypothetical protein
MRKFALAGAAVFAQWAMASNGAWADPVQPPVSQTKPPVFDAKSPVFDPKSPIFQSGIGNQDFSFSDEKIEALKKKLNGKGDTGSGGHFGGPQDSPGFGGYQNPALPNKDDDSAPGCCRRGR